MKLCPYCDRELVKRNGKFGEFWGCHGYPECDYTEPIKGMSKSEKLDREATAYLKKHGYGRNGI